MSHLDSIPDFHSNGVNSERRREFVQLLSEIYNNLHAYVFTIIGNAVEADDVMQETCLLLWKKFDDFQTGSNFGRWARTVALNLARNHARKRQRHQGYGLSPETLNLISQTHVGGTELLELRRERLSICMKRLASDDRKFLSIFYSGEMTISALARQVGRTPKSLYRRLDRLRKKLYDCVTRSLADEEDLS
ncbi:sigma-70 family RNA polymerase sigma factor [Calycomorphotria hydatis]|uniref:RNA polymerase sigma factor n=1 Tax=Calycomorphotria hydatis TaxID=2528027 RepID=A0A517TAM8_9PLAN|nr:sigma-70 family RNA polymerase sigma factor [Calycomorphotria hydatis]QDT65423.1 RNA polymerase sigma factor [Calycomorphotria hydatis]